MNGKELKKIIKEYFKEFAKKNNFLFYKNTVMIRCYKNVLHTINFDIIKDHFYCDIAIQPLYEPRDFIGLGFGDRINSFKTRGSNMFGYDKNEGEVKEQLRGIEKLLYANVLPWFKEVGSPTRIINFFQNAELKGEKAYIEPRLKQLYLGYSYVYTGNFDLGKIYLKKYLSFFKISNSTAEWKLKQIETINEIIRLIDNEPDKVSDKMGEFINFTINSLKLKIKPLEDF